MKRLELCAELYEALDELGAHFDVGLAQHARRNPARQRVPVRRARHNVVDAQHTARVEQAIRDDGGPIAGTTKDVVAGDFREERRVDMGQRVGQLARVHAKQRRARRLGLGYRLGPGTASPRHARCVQSHRVGIVTQAALHKVRLVVACRLDVKRKSNLLAQRGQRAGQLLGAHVELRLSVALRCHFLVQIGRVLHKVAQRLEQRVCDVVSDCPVNTR